MSLLGRGESEKTKRTLQKGELKGIREMEALTKYR
jgi:hypothetical protein